MDVSIILTSYNHERFIRRSIDSVLNQTYQNFQLVIVDDCSQDNSWEIIQEYNDRRIIAIRNPYNMRTEGFYDAIYKYVKGKYVAVHHSDDEWLPDKLEKQVKFMEKHPEIAACFTGVQVIDEDSENYLDKEGFYYQLFEQKNRSRFEWLNYFFYHGNCLCHPSVLLRSDLFWNEEMFDFGYAQIPDFSRWVRICLKHEIYILPEKLTRFRVLNEGKNTSGNRPDTVIRSSIELYNLLKLYSKIPTSHEFLKVFPEGNEFANKVYISEYAFARICVRPEMDSYTKLYGFELLYRLMNTRKIAELIEDEYNFTFRDLISMTGKKDIFHVLPEGTNQTRSIYMDWGNGFDEDSKISQAFYFDKFCKFTWRIKLPEKYKKKVLKCLRFDPLEGITSMCVLYSVQLDGEDIDMIPYNALDSVDNYDMFQTRDPVYVSKELYMQVDSICISGEVKRLRDSDLDKHNERRLSYEALLNKEIKRRDEWIDHLKKEKGDQICLNESLKLSIERLNGERAKLECENKLMTEQNSQVLDENKKLEAENKEIKIENKKVSAELADIKSWWVYKVWSRLKKRGI